MPNMSLHALALTSLLILSVSANAEVSELATVISGSDLQSQAGEQEPSPGTLLSRAPPAHWAFIPTLLIFRCIPNSPRDPAGNLVVHPAVNLATALGTYSIAKFVYDPKQAGADVFSDLGSVLSLLLVPIDGMADKLRGGLAAYPIPDASIMGNWLAMLRFNGAFPINDDDKNSILLRQEEAAASMSADFSEFSSWIPGWSFVKPYSDALRDKYCNTIVAAKEYAQDKNRRDAKIEEFSEFFRGSWGDPNVSASQMTLNWNDSLRIAPNGTDNLSSYLVWVADGVSFAANGVGDWLPSFFTVPFDTATLKKPEVWDGIMLQSIPTGILAYFHRGIAGNSMKSRLARVAPLAVVFLFPDQVVGGVLACGSLLVIIFQPVGLFYSMAEEPLFRGLLQPAAAYVFGLKDGLFFSSFVFAVLHVSNVEGSAAQLEYLKWNVAPKIVGGMHFGWLAMKSGSVEESIAAHHLFNTAGITVAFFTALAMHPISEAVTSLFQAASWMANAMPLLWNGLRHRR